jgi:DNA-binding CsgD family transcriptional regulator
VTRLDLVADQAELVDRIYEAALGEGGWSEILEHLAGALGGPTALHAYDLTRGRGTTLLGAAFQPEVTTAYHDHYCTVNPWMRESRRSFDDGELVISSEIYPDEQLVRTEFHDDFLRPNDLFYSMGGVLLREQGSVVSFTNLRSRRVGLYRPEERAAFRSLIPHLKRALLLSRRLEAATAGRTLAFELLDRLPYGVVLLDGAGRVLHGNRAARSVLDAQDGLSVREGQLAAASSADTARLRRLVAAAARVTDGAGPSAGDLVLERPSGRAPYVLAACPLRAPAIDVAHQARVALFVTDPEGPAGSAELTLARVYRLTPAETRLAAVLAQGLCLSEAGARFGVSANTVRTQLKSLFAKTGTRRQSDLVRLLLTLPPPGPEPDQAPPRASTGTLGIED